MRRFIAWVLITALMLMSFTAVAETVSATTVNGAGAVRTSSELYVILKGNGADMLVRMSSSGEIVCIDRADTIDSVVPYAGGTAYLKTDKGVSEIMLCSGNSKSVMYRFDGMNCENLSVYGDDLLVMSNGLLYSVDPNDQVCLKLSGAQMLEYCVGGDYAYYLSGTDMMKYSADITDNGETITLTNEVGCIYRLDLTSGETMLMLKSGGEDIKLKGTDLYFHSMQQIYAVHSGDEYQLCGRLYSLSVTQKNLNEVCKGSDRDYWPMDSGVAVWVEDGIQLLGKDARTLYTPAADAQVTCDGSALYVWEPSAKTLTRVAATGLTEVLFSGEPTSIQDMGAATPEPTIETTPEPTPIAAPMDNDTGITFVDPEDESVFADDGIEPLTTDDNTESVLADGETDWFDDFLAESENIDADADAFDTIDPDDEFAEPTAVPQVYTTPLPDSMIATKPCSYPSVHIVESPVNVRIGPGTDYEKIGSIPVGATTTLMGLEAKASNGTVWYKVAYKGMTGWVSSKFAKPSNAASKNSGSNTGAVPNGNYKTYSMDGKYAHVTGGSANIRKGPGKEYGVATTVLDGVYLTFKGVYAKDSRGVKWYKVTANGVTGWISSGICKITNSKSGGTSSGSKVKTTGDVTIRQKPNKNSKRLGFISAGVSVKYLGSSSVDSRGVRWYKIKYDGIIGWISSKYSKLK